jgi:glycosyltransferase involved in cell wall biosynthesis
VVTIVYNDVDEIENTIKSVLSQTYPYIEYIIIDGGSTDGTVQTIKLYEEKIAYWHSKKDDGIYDAMNKANKLANGDYIFFLNSGDIFSTNNILEKIFSNLEKEYKLLAGRTNISYKNKNLDIVSPPPNIFLTKKSKTFSHQATFIHKSIYKNFDYDLHYKISADKEYWYKIKNIDDFNVKFYDLVIAGFELGGVSNNHKNVLNRRIEDLYIEYQYDKVTLKKFLKYFAITIISYLITINEDFYFNKIYPMLNNIKNKMVKK